MAGEANRTTLAMAGIAAGENFERILTRGQKVKYSFVHLCTHPGWIDFHLHIDINELGMISVNRTNWHGKAVFTVDPFDDIGEWTLTFQDPNSVLKADGAIFTQVPDTNVYLCKGTIAGVNTLLIPKVELR